MSLDPVERHAGEITDLLFGDGHPDGLKKPGEIFPGEAVNEVLAALAVGAGGMLAAICNALVNEDAAAPAPPENRHTVTTSPYSQMMARPRLSLNFF